MLKVLGMRWRVGLIVVALVLGSVGSIWAYVVCYDENYGNGSCATFCVIYDEHDQPTGWIRGPLQQCE